MSDALTEAFLQEARKYATAAREQAASQSRLTIARQAKRIRELEDEIAALRRSRPEPLWGDPAWNLGATEMRLLDLLVRHKLVTFDMAMDALYWNKGDPPTDRMITVWVSFLRKRMGVTITNHRGLGYSLGDADRQRLLRACPLAA